MKHPGPISGRRVASKKPKKRQKENYRTQADRRFSIAVRGIGFCENCGSVEFLQCAHIVSRSYSATRVDFLNAVCLCRGCHVFFTHRPLEWWDWARRRIGEEAFDELRRLAVGGAKIDWKAEAERLKTDLPGYRPSPVSPR
ncbi:MAG: hypothetical protein M3537_06450 [Chloroflexota bacterium]|nr:hypothetical protein [Chloroflexota bacterium]